MQDDFIQGIMFSRSNFMDLRRITKSERNLYKILALSHAPRGKTGERLPELPADRSPIRVGTPGDTIAPQIIKLNRPYLSDNAPSRQPGSY